MYLVKLINDNEEIYINTVSTSLSAPRITGSIKLGINTINNFTFNIFPKNPGYYKIHELKTLVEVFNTKTTKTEFKGRVLLPRQTMADSGLIAKTVVCECELGYLMDSTQRYGEYHDITIKDFLKVMIENHNRQVSPDKRFVVGEVTVDGQNDNLYRFLGYEKTLDTIKDKLIDRLGGELRVRHKDGIRYLDYVKELGYISPTQIRLSKNLKSIEEEKDPSEVITRLVPLGAKIKALDSDGNEVDTEERLTIKSVNNGKDYIDDLEAIKQFGIVERSEVWDDINFPDILLTRGNQFIQANNKVRTKYNVTALDLSLIDLEIGNIDIYNYYHVYNPLMGIDDFLRVVEKTIIIEKPHESSINIGDKFEDIKQYQLNIKKATQQIKEVDIKLNSAFNKVSQVENNIVQISSNIEQISADLSETSSGITGLNSILVTLSDNVVSNTNKIKTIESEITSLKSDVYKNKQDIAKSNTKITTMQDNINTIKTDVTATKGDISEINTKLEDILIRLAQLETGGA